MKIVLTTNEMEKILIAESLPNSCLHRAPISWWHSLARLPVVCEPFEIEEVPSDGR